MKRIVKISTVGILASLILTGCAGKGVQPSGFLGDSRVYSAMQPDSEVSGVKSYKTVENPLQNYDSFIVPPVSVYLNEKGQKRNITEEDLRELAELFRSSVIKELGSHYKVVNTPSNKTAILRLAITDTDPNIAIMNIHPGSLIIGGGLGGATAEADLIDSVSGRRVAAFLASSKGKRYKVLSGLTKWGHTESVLKEWAALIGERVNKAHPAK